MKRWLRRLRYGSALHHLPVALPAGRDTSVRVALVGLPEDVIDVTDRHLPVSLRPLVIGVRLGTEHSAQMSASHTPALEIRDTHGGDRLLARIQLSPAGAVPLMHGSLHLFETVRCANWCVPLPARWLRYALAWQHARSAWRRGERLPMSASDLVCLNAYSIVARPAFFVGAEHAGRRAFLPMDLAATTSPGEYVFALEATHPAIPPIDASRRVAICGTPSDRLDDFQRLGRHPLDFRVGETPPDIPLASSPRFGLPVLGTPGLVREVLVREVHRVGSHVLFVCEIEAETGTTPSQLAYVSGMYAEWRVRHGRPHLPS